MPLAAARTFAESVAGSSSQSPAPSLRSSGQAMSGRAWRAAAPTKPARPVSGAASTFEVRSSRRKESHAAVSKTKRRLRPPWLACSVRAALPHASAAGWAARAPLTSEDGLHGTCGSAAASSAPCVPLAAACISARMPKPRSSPSARRSAPGPPAVPAPPPPPPPSGGPADSSDEKLSKDPMEGLRAGTAAADAPPARRCCSSSAPAPPPSRSRSASGSGGVPEEAARTSTRLVMPRRRPTPARPFCATASAPAGPLPAAEMAPSLASPPVLLPMASLRAARR